MLNTNETGSDLGLERLPMAEGLEAISSMTGHKLHWNELSLNLKGSISEVKVKKEESNGNPVYLEIEVDLIDNAEKKCTLGTTLEMGGVNVDKDPATGDLHVRFVAPYNPVHDLVIEN